VLALRDAFMAKRTIEKSGPQNVDTFRAYLESYLAAGKGPQGRWNTTTKIDNEKQYRLIKPHIPENLKLKDVNVPAIQRILDSLDEADANDRRAQSSYNNVKTFLSCACRMAAVRGLMPANPVKDAIPLRGNDADTHAYSLKEVRAMVEAIDPENNPDAVSPTALRTMKTAFLVAILTGMRPEELKGLRWEDYRDGMLHVTRAVVHRKVVATKTKASAAPVPVVKLVKDALAEHLKYNSGTGYIFHREGKSPEDAQTPAIFENYIRNHVRPILEDKGIAWHGMHAFRRGAATIIQNLDGVGDRLVSHVLRHEIKKDDVTGSRYVKRDVDQVRKVLERVEAEYKKIK